MRRAVLIHPKGHISTHICANRLRHRLHRVQAAKKVIRLLHIWVHQQRRSENILTKIFIFCSDCLIWWPSEMQRNKQLDYLFEYMTVCGNPHEFCSQNYKQGLIIASSREIKRNKRGKRYSTLSWYKFELFGSHGSRTSWAHKLVDVTGHRPCRTNSEQFI